MNQLSSLRDESYYNLAHTGSLDLTHPSMRKLLKILSTKNHILDMGCGEGTRLNLLVSKANRKIKAVGVDVNKLAIQKAKQQYPNEDFQVADLRQLPFKESQFDLIYSAYVFEHLIDVEKVIEEGFRVLKPKGIFVIIAPNFGAPNRRSPNSTESKIRKIIVGFLKDFNARISSKLDWMRVDPKSNVYKIDSDTTIEPYLGSLINYSKSKFKTTFYSSFWKNDSFSMFQLPFRVLGLLRIYPFFLWGPHMMVILEKK